MKEIPAKQNDRVQKKGRAARIRAAVDEIWLKTIRLYTFNTPIAKGKYRLFLTALKFCRFLPEKTTAKTKDGRQIGVKFSTGMYAMVYFVGEYEKAITEIVISLLRTGDKCLDIGANFGWYTTIFHKYCGVTGETHAFEPVPPTFQELEQNFELMHRPSNVFINNLAVGEKAEETIINMFADLPSGHSSLSTHGRDDAITFKCQVVTLDSYLKEKNVGDINFVKVDIEGAELMFLKGAGRLFKQAVPPILLMEMALNQTNGFGYTPNDLLEYIREQAEYDFYMVDEIKTKLRKLERFEKDDLGGNVICLPRGFYQDRRQAVKWFD